METPENTQEDLDIANDYLRSLHAPGKLYDGLPIPQPITLDDLAPDKPEFRLAVLLKALADILREIKGAKA